MIEFCSRLIVSPASLACIVTYNLHISIVVSKREGFLCLCTPVAPSAPPEALTSSMSLWKLHTALWQARRRFVTCALHSREEMCFYVIRDVYHRHNTLFPVMLNSSTQRSPPPLLIIQLKLLTKLSAYCWFCESSANIYLVCFNVF